MHLKILGVFKKPPVKGLTKEKTKSDKIDKGKDYNEGYQIISTETVPVEFYCELPPKVREQLVKNLAGGIDLYSNPVPDVSPRTIVSAI